MKVLMVGNSAYVHVRRWATGIASLGADVVLLSSQRAQLDGVSWYPDEVPPARPWRLRRWKSRRRTMLRHVVSQVRPDVIHLHFPGPYSLFPDDLGGMPLVVTTWGSEVRQDADKSLEAHERKVAILRRADRVVASSEFLADETRSYASLPNDKVEVIYWGVDLEKFAPLPEPVEEPVIGFAKHLIPTYGPEYMIEALRYVAQRIPDVRLRISGEGRMEAQLRQLAHHLGLEARIEWCGSLPHSTMPSFFQSLALSVMPSIRETLGVAALESQAVKVPVVASRVGGVPESVVDGKTGILVSSRDSTALGEAIVSMLSSREMRMRMGANGRAHVEQHFDWDATLRRMVDLYRLMLSSPKMQLSE